MDKPTTDRITGKSFITGNKVNLHLGFERGLQATEKRLFLYLIFLLSQQSGEEKKQAEFTLNEYMSCCYLKHRTTAKEQIEEGLKNLSKIWLEYKHKKQYWKIPKNCVLGNFEIKQGGRYCFSFSPPFLEHFNCKRTPLKDFNIQLFKVDVRRYPGALTLGNKILDIANMRKNNEYELSLNILVKSAGLPTFEEVKKNHKSFYKKMIIKPLDCILKHLKKICFLENFKYSPVSPFEQNFDHKKTKVILKINFEADSQNEHGHNSFKGNQRAS